MHCRQVLGEISDEQEVTALLYLLGGQRQDVGEVGQAVGGSPGVAGCGLVASVCHGLVRIGKGKLWVRASSDGGICGVKCGAVRLRRADEN